MFSARAGVGEVHNATVRDGAWVTALHTDCLWMAEGKFLPGVQADVMAPNKPYKSIIKMREDQMSLLVYMYRDAHEPEASLRTPRVAPPGKTESTSVYRHCPDAGGSDTSLPGEE